MSQLICAFGFAYSKRRFFHDAAHTVLVYLFQTNYVNVVSEMIIFSHYEIGLIDVKISYIDEFRITK